MAEKKRSYDADTLSVSDLDLRKCRGLDGSDSGKRGSHKRASRKSGDMNSASSYELIQKLIEKMKESW